MSGEELSRALSDISMDKIEAAAEITPKPRRQFWLRVAAIAAAIAVLITALHFWPAEEEKFITGPGLLVVRANAAENGQFVEENSKILEEGVTFSTKWTLSATSAVNTLKCIILEPSIPDTEYKGMNISYEISVSAGSFENNKFDPSVGQPSDYENLHAISYACDKAEYLGNHFVIHDRNARIEWNPTICEFDDSSQSKKVRGGWEDGQTQAFIDIIIRADDHIVGYAVIELNRENLGCITATLVTAVTFPQIDGRYQDVSEDYVTMLFQELHENTSAEWDAKIQALLDNAG